MKKSFKGFLLIILLLAIFVPVFKAKADTKITELELYGTEDYVEEGELNPFGVWMDTDQHITIEDYSDNTGWSYRDADHENWIGMGANPVAAADNVTVYAMRLKVETASGYELDENVKVTYNDEEADVTVSKQTWGGYIYIDLGMAIKVQTVNELDFEMTLPKAGSKVTINEETRTSGDYTYTVKVPDYRPEVKNCPNCDYFPEELMFINDYPDSTGETTMFEGTFEEGKEYLVELYLFLTQGNRFGKLSDFKVKVNGKEVEYQVGEWYKDTFEGDMQVLVYFKVPVSNGEETPDDNTEEYVVETEDGNSISFVDEEGKTFNVTITDVMTLTDEELTAKGVTKEEYDEILKTIEENTKDKGTLVSVFAIEVNDGTNNISEVEGGFKIKIKMTDEMKKYNTFKMINIDETDFSVKDIVELKVEGDYLVGTLPHLSVYALAATNVENPATGDSALIWVSILSISLAALSFVSLKKVRE